MSLILNIGGRKISESFPLSNTKCSSFLGIESSTLDFYPDDLDRMRDIPQYVRYKMTVEFPNSKDEFRFTGFTVFAEDHYYIYPTTPVRYFPEG